MQFAIDVFEVTGHNDSVLGATRVSVNATLPEQQREAKVGSRPVAVPRASNMEGICVLMDELKFTPGHVNSVFDLHDNITGNSVDVLPIKFQKMSMLNSEWHYMRKHQIARFEVDGSINVYGFSSVHVLNHPAWAARLLLLAREISPRSQKEPIACVYEIMKFCGMEVVGTKRHGPPRSDKKKSLEQDAYVFKLPVLPPTKVAQSVPVKACTIINAMNSYGNTFMIPFLLNGATHFDRGVANRVLCTGENAFEKYASCRLSDNADRRRQQRVQCQASARINKFLSNILMRLMIFHLRGDRVTRRSFSER
jgi:hypothetical protein